MRRRQHYLRPNKGTELPHNLAWVDTETRPARRGSRVIRHVLRFGWGCFQRTRVRGSWTKPDWFRFSDPRAFWEALIARTHAKSRVFVFAHNWSFDAPVLDVFRILPELGFKLTYAIVEGPPVVLVFRRGDLTLELLDTLNWWRTSLVKLGESIGVAKLTMPRPSASRVAWDRYCRQDVEVIRRAVHFWIDFLERYDLGGFARTLAGQSFRAYRHRFMDAPILIDDCQGALELARESYHGGRTEAFFIGKLERPVHCLDVNSMYPYVMRDRSFPTVLRGFFRQATFAELARWLESRAVVARVTVRTDEPRYAVFDGTKLVFPVGEFTTSLTTPDLAYALEHGHLARVHEAAVYDATPLFSRFVTEVYSLRLDALESGNSVQHYLLKILLNSLYGKFAQRGTVWEPAGQTQDPSVRVWSEVDVETDTVRTFRQFGGLIQEQRSDSESLDSHPAIASHVTAYARALLWDLMLRAGRQNVYYCDTDSLYVNNAGLAALRPLIDRSTLGALKLEASYPWLVIHGAKDYEAPEHRVCKGVRSSARWLTPDIVRQEKWSSLKGLLRTGDLSAPTTELIEKRLSRRYDKGTVTASGKVLPLRLTGRP